MRERPFQKGHTRPRASGRKKRTPNQVPATVKRTLLDVLRTIENDHADDIQAAILDGIHSGPRMSAPFIKLLVEYRCGELPEKVEL